MGNTGQQWATMDIDNNGQQWTTMHDNGQQWTIMDSNGQQCAVLHASVMPFLLLLAPVVFEKFRPSVEVARQILVLRCVPNQQLIPQPFLFRKSHLLDSIPIQGHIMRCHLI